MMNILAWQQSIMSEMEDAGSAVAAVAAGEVEYAPGEAAVYRPTGETVHILKVHREDYPEPPYYSVRMADSREKQTVPEKLEKLEKLLTPSEPDSSQTAEPVAEAKRLDLTLA